MCGIAGLARLGQGPPPTRETLRAMGDTLIHRGPDDEGFDLHDGVGLAMRRLAIIDPAEGRQPLFNEDRTVRVVFNGEIYNYRELRRELASRGHRFDSATDGEVIAHLWEELGPRCLARLNGMFAIAVHDTRQRRLFLARDRLGIKPLYFSRAGDQVAFGSEIKALLASGIVARELDVDALGQFLAWEYVPAPQTLLRGVRKLDAAESLEIDLASGKLAVRSWWDVPPPAAEDRRSDAAWADAVDAKLRECVRRQLVSDVPLGAFLSGGVDSSLVVSAMPDAATFSIGFDDPSYDELPWARAVARHLQVRHRFEIIRPQALELFSRLMHFMDDPIGDVSIFPTFLVSELSRQAVTVALTGDGGDELFGGYDTYVAQLGARTWGRLPRLLTCRLVSPLLQALPPRPQKKGLVNKAKRFVEGLAHDARLGHARWRVYVGEAMRESLFAPEALAAMTTPAAAHVVELFDRAGPRDEIDRCLYVDMKSYLVDNCLVKVDRMSMACSLEARVPFLDHELVELAFRVPSRLKVLPGRTKVLLKRVAERHLPRRTVYRTKQGFSIPMKNWLSGPLRPLMDELLDPARLAADGIFRANCVESLKREHLSGRANHSHVLWPLIVFQDWRARWAV